MPDRKPRRLTIAPVAAVMWLAGIAMAAAMSDGDGGPGGRRIDPGTGPVPACAEGLTYDAKLNRCTKGNRRARLPAREERPGE